jgi:glycosyltransferase involved in cell wall biosynthesis
VEAWLTNLVRQVDPSRVAMDFLVHAEAREGYVEEIAARGCRIIVCSLSWDPVAYAFRFLKALREYGPYDVVHSHVHHFSGYILWLARLAGVPGRIAHSHSDTSRCEAHANVLRTAYTGLMAAAIRRNATVEIGANQAAGEALFGPAWQDDPRRELIHCGIDTEPFQNTGSGLDVRAEFRIPADAFVVGHVGRFVEPKNHKFLVEMAQCLVRLLPKTRFLWIGDGPLRPAIQAQVAEAKLSDRVLMPGSRRDVPRMLAAMDAFVFPSLWEASPLSLTEAQAAGVPCIASDAIAPESFIVKDLVAPLALSLGPATWASATAGLRGRKATCSRSKAFSMIQCSSFAIPFGATLLERIYLDQRDSGLGTTKGTRTIGTSPKF